MATLSDFGSLLLASAKQTHIFHLQTTSFAEHNALGSYYDNIEDLYDSFAESVQGRYGRITGYTNYELQDWISTEDTIAYFQELCATVQTQRLELPQDSYIQNQIDEIVQLLYATKYKLTLK